ncbi:MAG TPA: chloride channel protein [Baekduia sp.]|uniref:chloride channel protein n=1 Tax=Baekduia sp. TaxID=2600305 RepID=UPI002D76FD0F|nr:chloride channel protein [Baekduia sp.]HET6508025.1 chloride channel protein [Baekduia sp.]
MPDPGTLLRSRAYVRLLALAAVIGAPISALAYGYLKVVQQAQRGIFQHLPGTLGFGSVPAWWPLPWLALSGALTALAIARLPGTGGHSPADGFHPAGTVAPIDLPGILLASLATLCLGAVLGPEAPLVLLGSGLGALATRLVARDAPDQAVAAIAAAGSFAAIGALMGSPLLAAFLLLEAAGLGGAMVGVVLLPGLLAAGIGSLVFVGLNSLTGFGELSLALPDLPPIGHPTATWFLYAFGFGLLLPVAGVAIFAAAKAVRAHARRRMSLALPLLGLLIGGLAVGFGQVTGRPATDVLFSGQTALPGLVGGASSWSVGALCALLAAKGIAYALSLSGFRGGPIFPAMYLGAAAGILASRLPGLPLVPAVAMGIGAMSATMLGLPLTSALLATVLLGADGTDVLPVVIVAVVVSHVATAHLTPRAEPAPASPGAAHPPIGVMRAPRPPSSMGGCAPPASTIPPR